MRGLFFQSKVDTRERNRRKPTWGELSGRSENESGALPWPPARIFPQSRRPRPLSMTPVWEKQCLRTVSTTSSVPSPTQTEATACRMKAGLQGDSCLGRRWRESPGRGEGFRVQEKGSSHQIQALISEPLTQKLGTHPPLGQPSYTREGGVLLLEAGGRRGIAVRGRHSGLKISALASLLLFTQPVPSADLHTDALHTFSHVFLTNT